MKAGTVTKRISVVWVVLLAAVMALTLSVGADAAEKKASVKAGYEKAKTGSVRLMAEGDEEEEEEPFEWSVESEVIERAKVGESLDLDAFYYVTTNYEYVDEYDFNYSWYEGGQTLESYDYDYYIEEVQEMRTIYCDVEYEGDVKTIKFIVSPVTWYFAGDSYIDYTKKDADAGRKLTLDPQVKGLKDGENPTYVWYKSEMVTDEYGDEYPDWVPISGATGATYQAPCEPAEYWVEVTVGDYTDGFNFYVNMDTHFTVTNENPEEVFVAKAGDDAVLKVDASNDLGESSISYEWERMTGLDEDGDEEYSPISGADEASYTVPNVTRYQKYRCEASDTYGNGQYVYFIVSVENGFDVEAEDSYLYVPAEEAVRLHVVVNADQSEPLNYEWYIDGEKKSGSSDAFEIAKVTESHHARCVVTDKYGCSKEVWFEVEVDNEFEAEADDRDVTVPKGSPAQVKVNASCSKGTITYSWERAVYDQESDSWTWESLEGEEGDTVEIPSVDSYVRYECRAHDQYGSTRYIQFDVHPESGLKLENSYDQYVYVDPDASASLKVDAAAAEGEPLTYEWRDEDKDLKLDGDTAEFTTENITKRTTFTCIVRDQYGYSVQKWFYVRVDSGLEIIDCSDDQRVEEGDDATLSVTATAKDGVEISYRWEDYKGNDIPGETNATLSLTGIKKTARYYCKVSDQYGNSEYSDEIRVIIDNGLQVRSNGTEFYLKPGESCKLMAEAVADDDSKLTYTWEKYIQSRYDWVRVNPKDEDKPNKLEVGDLKKYHTQYRCEIDDGYGNTEELEYDVYLDTGLKAEYEDLITVEPGTTNQKIKLTVTSNYDDNTYRFKWYREGGSKRIGSYDTAYEGAATDELTIKEVTASDDYTCLIKDQYGCEYTAEISLKVDNKLKGTVEKETVSIEPDGTGTLKFNVSAVDTTDMKYWWSADYNDGSTASFPDAKTGELKVDKPGRYECVAQDRFGNRVWGYFKVVVNGGLKLTFTRKVSAAIGKTVTLKIDAQTETPDQLEFNWWIPDGDDDKKVTTTTGSYSFVPDRSAGIEVEVTDGYNKENAYINLTVDSGLTAKAEKETVKTTAGASVTLKVNAATDSPKGLTYEWYDINDDEVAGATGASCTFKAAKTGTCRCYVSDGYNWARVDFQVQVDTGLKVTSSSTPAATDGVIKVDPGQTVKLTVTATGGSGSFITYNWGDGEGGTSTLTIKDPYTRNYTCRVSDGVDTQKVVFNVKVNSGLKAAAYYSLNGGAKKALSSTGTVQAQEGDELKMMVESSSESGATHCYWFDRDEGAAYDGNESCTITVGGDVNITAHAGDQYDYEEFTFKIRVITCTHSNLTKTAAVKATCKAEGHTEYWTCSDCGKIFKDSAGKEEITLADTVIARTDHTWGEWQTATEPTCTKAGAKARECTVCHEKQTEEIPAAGHKLTKTAGTHATCEEPGSIDSWNCSACGKIFKSSEAKPEDEITAADLTVPALGHDWGEWTEVTPATETAEGEEQRVCKNDPNHVQTRPIPMIGHVHEIQKVEAAPATCDQPGNTEYWQCTGCGHLFADAEGSVMLNEEDVVIPAKGHDWGDWEEKTAPTCQKEGEAVRTCKNDPTHTDTKAIDKIDHKLTKVERVEPTATEDGHIDYWTCSMCGKYFVDEAGTWEISPEDVVIRFDPNPVPDVDPITPGDETADEAAQDTSIPTVAASKIITTGNVGKKTLTVKFPVASADNYRIQYRKAGATSWKSLWTAGKGNITLRKMAAKGLYQVRVAGYKKQDDGTWRRGKWTLFYRYMATTKITKVKPGKRSLALTWAKASGATGYKIQYSLKSTMKSAKTITVKGASKTKYTIKKLKKGKTYYVRIRPYKKSGSKEYAGILCAKKKGKAR